MLLSSLFLRRFSGEFKKKIQGFSTASLGLLESHEWPGNVRELENRIQRAVLMAESSIIEPHDLGFAEKPEKERTTVQSGITLRGARERVEKDMILSAIDKNRGNIARSAEELGISRPTLYDLIKKHGIEI
jgi:two-component system NtrC family response regulator